MTIYQGLNFCGQSNLSKSMKWWDLGPFEDKQAGLVQSMGAKDKNCWEAVEIGTCQSRIYPTLAFQSAKSAERDWLLVPATLSDGKPPPNVQKIWPERTETLHSSHWMVANGWINWHLTVAKCAVPSGLSQRLTAFAHYSLTGLSYSTMRANMRVADCNNCWEAVEIGTW